MARPASQTCQPHGPSLPWRHCGREFERLPIQHNAPLDAADHQFGDDTKMLVQLSNGYIQNVCQRFALGLAETNLRLHPEVMVPFFKLPPWKNESDPTMREANDCFLWRS